jgi:CLIP-associating protein 1/2
MSFELAQELSSTFKGTSTHPTLIVTNTQTDVDKKIESLSTLKSYLKRNDVNVPTPKSRCLFQSDAVGLVFDSVKQGLASTNHPNLTQAALTCLVVLIKRMALQDVTRLKNVAPSILPLLVDRLGDVKDRYRELAMNSLVEFWKASPVDVEKTIKEVGFGSKSWRIREQVRSLDSTPT